MRQTAGQHLACLSTTKQVFWSTTAPLPSVTCCCLLLLLAGQKCQCFKHYTRVMWLHRTTFSRPTQTSETAGALFACLCASKQVVWGTAFYLSVSPITCRNAFWHQWQAAALSSAEKRGAGKHKPRASIYHQGKDSRRLPETPGDSWYDWTALALNFHPQTSGWSVDEPA